MKIQHFAFNPFPVNTYVIWDEKTKESVIIDAGCYYADEQDVLKDFISENDLTVKHLLATHLHLDHNFGSPFVCRTYNIPLEANKNDEFLLANMQNQASMFGMKLPDPPVPIGKYINEGDTFTIGNTTFSAIHVPGHSPGSIVFYFPDEKVIFSGDVLFRSSIGRTDLPGGDYQTLLSGIKNKLMVLPDDVKVYSGHGPETTIGYERENNPFL